MPVYVSLRTRKECVKISVKQLLFVKNIPLSRNIQIFQIRSKYFNNTIKFYIKFKKSIYRLVGIKRVE